MGPRLDRPGDGAATAPLAAHPGGAAASVGGWWRERGTPSPTSRQDAATRRRGGVAMGKLKEQPGAFPAWQATQPPPQQQIPDNPLALPIRFTHQRDDSVFCQQV